MAFDILLMNVAAVFAVINVVFVVILIGLYFQSWKKMRSSVSLALMTFAGFFLIQNLVIIIFWYTFYSPAVSVGAAPYLVAINALESIGLGNLVRLTWK